MIRCRGKLQPHHDREQTRTLPDASNESGRYEVYVQPFPPSGGKWQISAAGGVQPQWRRDGKELFYVALDGTLMAADVKPASTFEPGVPQPLFKMNTQVLFARNSYSPTADGRRFLVNSFEDATISPAGDANRKAERGNSRSDRGEPDAAGFSSCNDEFPERSHRPDPGITRSSKAHRRNVKRTDRHSRSNDPQPERTPGRRMIQWDSVIVRLRGATIPVKDRTSAVQGAQ